MQVVKDDLWLCDDCTIAACNDDYTGIDTDARAKEVKQGLVALGPNLVPDFDSETGAGLDDFSRARCAACRTHLHGSRTRFAVLGESP